MKITERQERILAALLGGEKTVQEIINVPELGEVNARTIQRDLANLYAEKIIEKSGSTKLATYKTTEKGLLNLVISEGALSSFFALENRAQINYDFKRLDVLKDKPLFNVDEDKYLREHDAIFKKKLKTAPRDIVKRERERITIELSWKSSQIEGNTYTLLETESLLKEGEVAAGKTAEETAMIINHKNALDFMAKNKDLFAHNISKKLILELHKILAENLIDPGLRERVVGITGSVYRPLDNKYQINEEIERMCEVINSKKSVFEKALIAFVYVCYLQPFNDGNKRTARILANAILYANDSFPLSLRAVNVNTYKLSILAYYELGSLGNVKKVFLDQAQYAIDNYAI